MTSPEAPNAAAGTPSATRDASVSVGCSLRRIGVALAAWEPHPGYFFEQLASIERQTWREWICIVTCDSSVQAIRQDHRLAPFFDNPRFLWIENERRLGHVKNFEKAVRECVRHGVDAIACSDQDDVWEADKLAVLAAELERHGPLSLVHSDMRWLDMASGEPRIGLRTVWQHERRRVGCVRPKQLMVRNVVTGCSMLFDADLARRYPEIPTGVPYHDQWYGILAACHGGVHAVASPLLRYRQHGANVVGLRSTTAAMRMLWAKGLGAWVREARLQWRGYVSLRRAMNGLGLGGRGLATAGGGRLASLVGMACDGAMVRNLCTLGLGAAANRILTSEDA